MWSVVLLLDASCLALTSTCLRNFISKNPNQTRLQLPRTSSEMDRLPEYQHAFPESQIVTYTGEGFPDFKQQIIYACAKDGQPITHNRHRIELNAEWEVPLHLPINVLTQLFTLSGDEIDAQGATCEAYIQEHFTAATELLPALQAALSSGALYETRPREQDLCYLSVRLQGPEKRKITIIAFGSLHTLKDIAQAFAWLCCALRPPPSREINLSIFNFNLSSRGNQSCVNLVIDLNLSWKDASGIESSWHKLFSNIIIVLNSPTTDRSQLRISGTLIPRISFMITPKTVLIRRLRFLCTERTRDPI